MSATEIGKTDTVGSAPPSATTTDDRRAAEREPAEDASVSPVVVHAQPEVTTPTPTVSVLRQTTAHVSQRVTPPAERGSGVKLASISRTGDRIFRGLSGGSGVLIVALVAFVGI